MSSPTVSVVIPVLERPAFLRRALASVAAQTLEDFECIVVDDGSQTPLAPVVGEFDDRFIYVRRDDNGGPAAARLTGYAHARAEVVVKLDSDDELLPRTLERAVELLAAHPEVGAVIGLALLGDRLPMRVRDGLHVVDPDEYVRRFPPPFDFTDVFRMEVVREWLAELPAFCKDELPFKLMLGLRHRVLYVDEQWDIHHFDAPDRLTTNYEDPRRLDDVRLFVAHFKPLLGARPCAPLDQYLAHRHWYLVRRGHKTEAGLLRGWLRERGIGPIAQLRILLQTRFRDRRGYLV